MGCQPFLRMLVAIRRADHQDRSRGRGGPQARDQFLEHIPVRFQRPGFLAGLVGSVSQHDQSRIAPLDVGAQRLLVPIQNDGGPGAVDPQRLVGDAGGLFRHPAEQAHGSVIQRLQLQLMRTRHVFQTIVGGAGIAVGRQPLHRNAVVVELERAAARLLVIEQFEVAGVRLHVDSFLGGAHRHADSAQPVDAVAGAPHQAVGMPAAGRAAAHILAPVSVPGTPREGVSASAVAEFFLEARAHLAGPFIRGRVRVAVVQNPHRTGRLALLVPVELLEERDQRGRILDGDFGAAGHVFVYRVVSQHARLHGGRSLLPRLRGAPWVSLGGRLRGSRLLRCDRRGAMAAAHPASARLAAAASAPATARPATARPATARRATARRATARRATARKIPLFGRLPGGSRFSLRLPFRLRR